MFKCTKCCKSFTSQYNLNVHLNKKVPCILEENNEDKIKCNFCNVGFASNSNLNKHLGRCVVRKNPELLLKHIEKQNELLAQKDIIIEQKDVIIEQLKEAKPDTDIKVEGDNAKINANIDNLVDNSVINNITNNNNITLIEQPFAFRSEEMLYLLKHHENDNASEFWILAQNIRDAMKKGDLDGMINSLLTFVHNNKKLKEGQNLRYCPDGKYKGELLIYDYDDKGIGFWRPSDIRPITMVLSKEFELIREKQDERNEERKDSIVSREKNTEKEQQNITNFGHKSEHLHEDLSVHDCVMKFIKKFRISATVPHNIRNDVLEDYHPLNDKTSVAVKAHKKIQRQKLKMDKSESTESNKKIDKEQLERDRLNEESRQKRKAEEAEDERKEEAYKRKCELDGVVYVSKVERALNEHYAKQQKPEKDSKKNKKIQSS